MWEYTHINIVIVPTAEDSVSSHAVYAPPSAPTSRPEHALDVTSDVYVSTRA